jgi:amino acid adenylation domain-containing protein
MTDSEKSPITHQPATSGPASFSQQSQWLLNQLALDSTAYIIVYLYRLEGPFDPAIFERSLDFVLERHDALRATFHLEDGVLRQHISPHQPFKLETVLLYQGDGETSARMLAEQENLRPFDLEHGPLFRAKLGRTVDGTFYFVFAVHHIVFDASSRRVLLNDLLSANAAFSAGSEPSLSPLEVTYLDFVRWQRETLQGPAFDSLLARWIARLDGAPPAFDLPPDRPRLPLPYRQAKSVSRKLSAQQSKLLKQFCHQESATLFTGILSAWAACLQRYSGQRTLVIGCPFSGRVRPELEPIVGMFVNTLPIRLDMGGDSSFRQLLQHTRKIMLEAIADQALPFERLVSELRLERDISRAPVYQITINKRPFPYDGIRDPFRLQLIHLDLPPTEFDLNLDISDFPDGICLELQYDSTLFMPESASLMLDHLLVLIENALANPELPLDSLEMMSASEKHRILVTWNDTAIPIPDICPYRLFEQWAENRPGHIALLAGDRTISYFELNNAANRLAHRLKALDLPVGTAIGLFVEPSVEAVVGMLAVAKSGLAYLAIPDDFPADRITFMLEDSGAPVVLTQSHLRDALRSGARAVIELDDDRANEIFPADNLTHGPGLNDPAIIYFTSGSTGKPKGVLIPHRAVLRLACDTRFMEVLPDDVVSQISSLSFDNSTEEIWGALSSGATLAILPAPQYISPLELQRAFERYGVTFTVLTTSLFNLIAQENPAAFRHLRVVDFGGESADYDSVRRVLEHGKPERLLNGYGPTEAATISTMYEIAEDLSRLASIPIGRPISNTTVYVVDHNLRPVPIGVPGEILIGGPGVALGYINRPELTADKFIPDHIGGGAGAVLYRTGDLGRFLPDGNLEFLGRADQQIKLRGFRIELEEIELVLREHPSVKEAAVVLHQGPNGRFLVAFCTSRPSPTLVPDLRAYLHERLPDFMVPSVFERLESLPYSASAKIDRLALSRRHVSIEPVAYEPPAAGTEQRLAALWQETLGVVRVGALDDFFELGGHSLLAARLFARIEKQFGKRLPLASVFRNSTLRALADLIDRDTGEAHRQSIILMKTRSSDLDVEEALVSKSMLAGHPPLFLVPGVGASVLYLRELGLQFDPGQPIFGLTAVWRDSDARFIEESAEVYCREIQRTFPQGPYLLAGHSGGGLVALEIARRLGRDGGRVAWLAFLDTQPPGTRERPSLVSRIHAHVGNLRGKSVSEGLGYLQQRSSLLFARLVHYLPGGRKIARRVLATASKRVARELAVSYYELLPYDGAVTIFHVTERRWQGRSNPKDVWSNYLRGPITFVDVPGDHGTMLKQPHVRELARLITEHLPPPEVQ